MIWQDKGYTIVYSIEIIIGFLSLYMACKMLKNWWKPNANNKVFTSKWFTIVILAFDGYLLVDKLGYLISVLMKAMEHYVIYHAYDYLLLGLDMVCTLGLIISTGIFAKSVIKFYTYTPNLKAPDVATLQIMRRLAKSFRWLILLFASKDLALGVLVAIMDIYRPIHYVVYASSYMTITFVFMLILFATIKIFIAMYKEAIQRQA